jgi:ribonuclease HI
MVEGRRQIIYIDGAARGNPGEAGIGVVIKRQEGQTLKQMYKYIGQTTNNVAEYTALIYALQEALILGLKDVIVNSDSELLVKQLNGEYKIKNSNLKSYYEQFLHLKMGFNRLEIKQISRQENKESDKLANKAIDSKFSTSLRIAD